MIEEIKKYEGQIEIVEGIKLNTKSGEEYVCLNNKWYKPVN